MPTLFLLDGHSLVYKAFHALGPLSNSRGEPTGAIFGFLQTFHRIRRDHEPTHLAVVFDPPDKSFRVDDFPEYKANRPPQPPELKTQFALLRALLETMRVPIFEVPRFEADDVLATLADWAVNNGGEACIVSVDKDLMQCAGPRVKILREHLGKIEMLDEDGVTAKMGVRPDQISAYLGLLGDSSDNIPGVPGIGKKRAAELLAEYQTLEALIEEARGKTKPKYWVNLDQHAQDALKSRALATVVRDVPLKVSWDDLAWEYTPSDDLRSYLARLEFRTLLEELGGSTTRERETKYSTVLEPEQLREVAAAIRESGRAAIDTETTGFDPYTEQLVGISLSWERDQAVYVPLRAPGRDDCLSLSEVREHLDPIVSDPRIEWIAHNWRFDYKFLLHAGFPVGRIARDTMIASYLTSPDAGSNGLKNLAIERLGIEMTEIKELIGDGDDMVTMASVDLGEISHYACQDADVTRQLADYFDPLLERDGLRPVHDEIEMPLVPVLGRIELEGIAIDRPHFQRLSREVTERLDVLRAGIYDLAGHPFNINSPKQLSTVLFEELGLTPQRKTSTGYSTDVTVLEALSGQHPLPARLVEYRVLEKLRGTYIDALPSLVNPVTGRIHTSLNQTIAATGRLSSSDPNLQNIPVRTEEGRKIREGFVARDKGWVLLGADYSQIELRILAHMSGDKALGEAFRAGADIHTATAAKIFRIEPGEVTKEMRTGAKAINFGIVYGMTAFRLARDLDISRSKAEEFISEYFKAYSGVRAFIDGTIEECRKTGIVRTLSGRLRRIPDINSSNRNTRQQAERVAVNSPIQGTSADMIKVAMTRIDDRLRREDRRARMILQVHDELIFDVPEEEIEVVKSLVVEEMAVALPLDVPIRVDASVGGNWAEI